MTAYWSYDGTERASAIRCHKADGAAVASFEFGRDVAGRVIRLGREDDLAIYYSYDDVDRLTAEVWRKQSDSSQVYAFFYDFDAANNRTRMRRENSVGAEVESAYYGYDAANALAAKALQPSGDVTYYYYDANGALTEMVAPAGTTYYEYGPHQLVTKITPPAGSPWNFYYDGRLNRYGIDKGGTFTYFLWDGLEQLEERDTSGDMVARYTHGNYRQYGIGSVVEIERHVNGATYYQYPIMDHRGTVYKVTDENAATQIEYSMDAFGRELSTPAGADPNVPNDLIYQANWLTLGANEFLYALSPSRILDRDTGRFLSRDVLPAQIATYCATDGNALGILGGTALEEELLLAARMRRLVTEFRFMFRVLPPELAKYFHQNLSEVCACPGNYIYAQNDPVNRTDASGLATIIEIAAGLLALMVLAVFLLVLGLLALIALSRKKNPATGLLLTILVVCLALMILFVSIFTGGPIKLAFLLGVIIAAAILISIISILFPPPKNTTGQGQSKTQPPTSADKCNCDPCAVFEIRDPRIPRRQPGESLSEYKRRLIEALVESGVPREEANRIRDLPDTFFELERSNDLENSRLPTGKKL